MNVVLRLIRPALFLVLALALRAQTASVYPVLHGEHARSLNGPWSFRYYAGASAGSDEAFYEPGFAGAAGWKTLMVPGHWELAGFAEPRYAGALEEGVGLYRRTFRLPAAWRAQGRRVFVQFGGALSGLQVWVDGRAVGSWSSAYNPCTFDVTEALSAGDETVDHVIAARVATQPPGWEFDNNDCWALSGLFRDVTVFSVPAVHLQEFSTHTTLQADGAARLRVSARVAGVGVVVARLREPDGRVVAEQALADSEAGSVVELAIKKPRLWTAETPALYRLELEVRVADRVLQTISERIGLREVTVVDGVLRLNGRPIKLRGVNHHDIEPDTGRAVTEDQMRRDLALMRAANINFVRTSHYPPHPRFIELCDELGFYVMCEVAIGHGESKQDLPEFRENILTRARATVARDRNRPSVIVWSIGNENTVTESELEAGRLVKALDPSRPICSPKIGSYFQANYKRLATDFDLYSPHYPVTSTVRAYAATLTRPTILTEYAHALGLATDRVQEQWELMQANPRLAGGAVWHFHDQGILRRFDAAVDRSAPTKYAWLDAHHAYDTNGWDGADGIVYANRVPQADYWQVRKVYAPVRLGPETLEATALGGAVSITLENRHDFRSLAGLTFPWALKVNGLIVRRGVFTAATPAQGREVVRLAVDAPAINAADVVALEITCVNEDGVALTERAIEVSTSETAGGLGAHLVGSLSRGAAPVLVETADAVRVRMAAQEIVVTKATGVARVLDGRGRVLVEDLRPHAGRRLNGAEVLRAAKDGLWTGATLTPVGEVAVAAVRDGERVGVTVRGRYPRPAAVGGATPASALVGGYTILVGAEGALEISYDYAVEAPAGSFTELGFAAMLPTEATEFRWVGQGVYPGYPGKDRLNEFGLFHLSRGDLRFDGNRRGTSVALLTTPGRRGVALVREAGDVAIENTVLSHQARVASLGNKGVIGETPLPADAVGRIAGRFTLVPLTEGGWPALLNRWFGETRDTAPVFAPFYHSYDR